jgi:hypothetical protein
MTNWKETLSRRRFAAIGVIAGLMSVPVVLGTRTAAAGDLPRLDETDRSAKALAYVHDASRIEADSRGGADRVCRTCRFYTKADEGWGPCTLFPGRAVSANGWCKGWVAKES